MSILSCIHGRIYLIADDGRSRRSSVGVAVTSIQRLFCQQWQWVGFPRTGVGWHFGTDPHHYGCGSAHQPA